MISPGAKPFPVAGLSTDEVVEGGKVLQAGLAEITDNIRTDAAGAAFMGGHVPLDRGAAQSGPHRARAGIVSGARAIAAHRCGGLTRW